MERPSCLPPGPSLPSLKPEAGSERPLNTQHNSTELISFHSHIQTTPRPMTLTREWHSPLSGGWHRCWLSCRLLHCQRLQYTTRGLEKHRDTWHEAQPTPQHSTAQHSGSLGEAHTAHMCTSVPEPPDRENRDAQHWVVERTPEGSAH